LQAAGYHGEVDATARANGPKRLWALIALSSAFDDQQPIRMN
jgi:hypothetical protein